jgi:hypothetical protein
MNEEPKLTPVGELLLDVLRDGRKHSREELKLVIGDELTSHQSVNNQITKLRKFLIPKGYELICELHRGRLIHYRIIRPITYDE